ncbi:MAG: Xaa-Pro peptidase family protein [Synergistaceae bacterium]|jgi:Xaa-Pro aminopeptidase|nr:Xaa-Pro peptidase family protein [Synergistaceae bacterium]
MIDFGKARALMKKTGMDALLVLSPENFVYTVGEYSQMHNVSRQIGCAMVVLSPGEARKDAVICMDFEVEGFLEHPRVKENFELLSYQSWIQLWDLDNPPKNQARQREKFSQFDRSMTVLRDALENRGAHKGTIGIEMGYVSVDFFKSLEEYLPDARFIDCTGLLLELHVVKSEEELALYRDMTKYVDEGLRAAAALAREGTRECDLLRVYKDHIYASGKYLPSDWSYFVTGSNGGRFAPSTERTIRNGDILRSDGGANGGYRGYSTDYARTWLIGDVRKDLYEMAETLYKAERMMLETVKPGTTFRELFDTSFDFIKKKYPWYERGHMGHSIGVGPSSFEPPIICPSETRPLEAGMVICVETPCYLKGLGGMNYEDMVIVTKTGGEVISHGPHFVGDPFRV